MKIDFSLVTRRTFLNTIFGGWLAAFIGGSFYGLLKFAFPTLGKEPDFVILKPEDFRTSPLIQLSLLPGAENSVSFSSTRTEKRWH